MADRKVSVALELQAGQYKGEAKSAARATEDLSDKVEELDRDITKIPPDAARAAAAMKLLGGEADSASAKLGSIGDKNTNLAVLDSKLRETRGEVRKLADEFGKTGDVDVFRKLGDAQGRLSALRKVREQVADSVEDGASDGFLKGVLSASKSGSLGQVGAAVGAALAVPLLAALGGALLGATGLGVAGAGLAGAMLGNPAMFSDVWGHAAQDVKKQFVDATRPFSADLYQAIDGIGPLIRSWHLDKIFKDALPYAQPLIHGLEGFTTGIVGGVGALVQKAGPAVAALSAGMVQLGAAAQSAFTDIADGADGGAAALHDTIGLVSDLIELFGTLTGAAEKAYGFVDEHPFASALATGGLSIPISIWSMFGDDTEHILSSQDELRQSTQQTSQSFAEQGEYLSAMSQKLKETTLSVDTLAGSMVNKLFTALMGVDQATLGVNSALLKVGETFAQNGRQIDKHTGLVADNTKKGIENHESVLAAVQANMALYQAQIAAGMSATDAAAQYDANTQSLERQLRAAHLTQGQIDALIGKYRGIPDTVNTAIAVQGLTDAINDLDQLLRQINGLHDKTIKIQAITYTYQAASQTYHGFAHGGIRHAAVGMIIPPSDPGTTIAAEPQTGGEALIPLKGISQSRAMGLAQVVGNNYGFSVGGGGGGGNITITLSGGDDLTSAMLKSIRYTVSRGYGGNVQVALGTNSR